MIILRFCGIYGFSRHEGVVANFIRNSLQNKPLTIESNTRWDMISAVDATMAIFLAFTKAQKLRFEIINIGGGNNIKIDDLARQIIFLSKSKSVIKNKPKKGLLFSFYYATVKAQELLGFKAQPLEVGLRGLIAKLMGN